jgi:hypothetical protein
MAEKACCPMALDRGAPTEDARSVLLSFSSEEPVLRGDRYEILLHDPDAVDLAQLKSEAPLLVNHSRRRRVGTVMDAWLENKCGWARVSFFPTQYAEVICQGVKERLFPDISVGYRHDMGAIAAAGEIEGKLAYRVVRWKPTEISLSSAPLDPTVGVDRIRKEDRARSVMPKGETMAVQQRKYVVRPASDFELVEKPTKYSELSAGEFDLLVTLRGHDLNAFRIVRNRIWWDKLLKSLTTEEFDELADRMYARRGKK